MRLPWLILLALTLLIPIADASVGGDVTRLEIRSDGVTVVGLQWLDGADARLLRTVIDQNWGNLDGTVSKDELDRYETASSGQFDPPSPCGSAFDFARRDGKSPVGLAEYGERFPSALGPVAGAQPVQLEATVRFAFGQAERGSWEIQFGQLRDVQDAWVCAAKPTFRLYREAPFRVDPRSANVLEVRTAGVQLVTDSITPSGLPVSPNGIRAFDAQERATLLAQPLTFEIGPSSSKVDLRGINDGPGGWLTFFGIAALILAAVAALRERVTVRVVRAIAWAGFSRHTIHEVANHPRRRLILEAVRADPNVNLRTLAAKTGLSKTSVLYHAATLEAHDLLRSHKVSGERCFVATESLRGPGRALLSPSPELIGRHDPAVGALLELLGAQRVRLNPLLVAISGRVGISLQGAWKVVARAERFGLVRREREGGAVWVERVRTERLSGPGSP